MLIYFIPEFFTGSVNWIEKEFVDVLDHMDVQSRNITNETLFNVSAIQNILHQLLMITV